VRFGFVCVFVCCVFVVPRAWLTCQESKVFKTIEPGAFKHYQKLSEKWKFQGTMAEGFVFVCLCLYVCLVVVAVVVVIV
jgi:hypothetical protein